MLEDWRTAEIPETTRAALKLLEYMTVHPQDIDLALIDELHQVGLGNLAIQEAANVGFHYNLIDRVADAFDFPVPEGVQQKRLARMLNITGAFLRGSAAEEIWVRQLGIWLYLPGATTISEVTLLCEQALQVATKQRNEQETPTQ